MLRLVCGLLNTSDESNNSRLASRARDLTVSWLRWGYFGDILEDTSVDAIVHRAFEQGYEHCLIQSYGHIISERSSPQGGRAQHFFDLLQEWIADRDYLAAGKIFRSPAGEWGLLSRCLLVNVQRCHQFGWPQFGPALSGIPVEGVSVERLEPAARPRITGYHACGGSLISSSLENGLPISDFGERLGDFLIDVGPDASACPAFGDAIRELSELAARGVFVLNFESYQDIEEPPAIFTPPVSVLYCVAAGLKPGRILHTHGFDQQTRVVYFDYSSQGLEFRRLLLSEWNGRDYPAFLRLLFQRLTPASTHYYLWPGATFDNLDWAELDRLWRAELARWGGDDIVADHWLRVRKLRHEFLQCNILTEYRNLLDRLEDRPGTVIWWSNAFSTIYSAWNYSLGQKRDIYGAWIRGIAERAPRALIYGSDHSNSSVNGISAGEYRRLYDSDGGDPLRARSFCHSQIRF
ncbi:MAG TPA: hypothetical protein VKE70_28815 [Candidatus Solibacter sp.]|nr:hypothetical protein [Candidatus Solibacter sp.]